MTKSPKPPKAQRQTAPSDEPAPPQPATSPFEGASTPLRTADPVIALAVIGTEIEVELSQRLRAFALGSWPKDDGQLHVSSKMVKGPDATERVSRKHLFIQRDGDALEIVDKSTNGTFVKGAKITKKHIEAGDTFQVADVALLALDAGLRLLREQLRWALGYDAYTAIDSAIDTIADGDALALIGPPNHDQLRVARQIHESSSRRDLPFVAITTPFDRDRERADASIELAARGTLFYDLSVAARPTREFVAKLFDKTASGPRVIFAAPDHGALATILDPKLGQRAGTIDIPALSRRRADVPRMLSRLFSDEGSDVAAEQLGGDEHGAHNLAALVAYDWKDMKELADTAKRLLALHQHSGNQSAASAATGIAQSTLSDLVTRLRLRFPRRK